jgi:hypothetical protein
MSDQNTQGELATTDPDGAGHPPPEQADSAAESQGPGDDSELPLVAKPKRKRNSKKSGATEPVLAAVDQGNAQEPWWPTEDEVDSDQWKLFDSATAVAGEPVMQGTYDAIYEAIISRRVRQKDENVVATSPDRTHIVPKEIEGRLRIAAIQARNWSVELQTGGVKRVLVRGLFPRCVKVFETAEKDHKAGSLVFLDPSGGAYMQRLKPMFRTVVTTPDDKDRIQIDQDSFKKYLQGDDEPQLPASQPTPAVAVEPKPTVAVASSLPAVPEPLIPPAPMGVDFLFEIQVLERILARDREAQLQLAVSQRTSSQQVALLAQVFAKFRGGGS